MSSESDITVLSANNGDTESVSSFPSIHTLRLFDTVRKIVYSIFDMDCPLLCNAGPSTVAAVEALLSDVGLALPPQHAGFSTFGQLTMSWFRKNSAYSTSCASTRNDQEEIVAVLLIRSLYGDCLLRYELSSLLEIHKVR